MDPSLTPLHADARCNLLLLAGAPIVITVINCICFDTYRNGIVQKTPAHAQQLHLSQQFILLDHTRMLGWAGHAVAAPGDLGVRFRQTAHKSL